MFVELFFVSMALSVLKGVSLLVSYINNNAFPQPLNEREEARCLRILSESKTEPFTLTREVEQARNTLVEHNLRLVAHLVKKFGIQIEYNIKEEERLFSRSITEQNTFVTLNFRRVYAHLHALLHLLFYSPIMYKFGL